MSSRHPLRDWSFWVKVLVSLSIAVGFGFWVHRKGIALLPSADQLSVLVRNWWAIPVFIIILCAVHCLRAYRWLYLLRPISTDPPKISTLFAVAFVGFMAIMLLPLRTGELARPYLISTRGNVKMSAAFGTIAIERVLDGLILSGLLTVCLLLLPLDHSSQHWARYVGVLTLAIFVAALGVLLLLLWKGEPVIELLERIGKRLLPTLADRVAGVLRTFLEGLSALPKHRHLGPFVLMSIAYWGINGIGMWFLANACGVDLTIIGGFTVMTMLAVGILLPTGPGHFGNFQFAVAEALGLQNLPQDQIQGPGSVFIFALYLGMLGLTLGAGAISLMTEHITLSRIIAPQVDEVSEKAR